jgi:hypothetical protein
MWCFFLETKVPPARRVGARRALLSNPGGLAPRRASPPGPGPMSVSPALALLFSPANKGPSPSTGPGSGSKGILALVHPKLAFCSANWTQKGQHDTQLLLNKYLALVHPQLVFCSANWTQKGPQDTKLLLDKYPAKPIIARVFCVVKSKTSQGSGHAAQMIGPTQPGEEKRHRGRHERTAETAGTAPILQPGQAGDRPGNNPGRRRGCLHPMHCPWPGDSLARDGAPCSSG